MPVRAEFKHVYGSPLWRLISRYIRFDRAKGLCEGCGVEHGSKRYYHPDGRECLDGRTWTWPDGAPAPYPTLLEWDRVIVKRNWLAAAHVDGTPEHVFEANLKSLCQPCHLDHDREQHMIAAHETRLRKLQEERRGWALGDLFRGSHVPPVSG